jgi:hypothetical protein
MISNDTEGYLSIIGMSYLHPITSLLEILEDSNPRGPNEVQASPYENGYSAAIIVLTVLLLESVLSRTQYMRGDKPPKKPLDFIRTVYPTSGFADTIEELFVVRDVIVHNHVWEAQFRWDETVGMKFISAQLAGGYGDAKHKKVLEPSNRLTRLLGINLFPTRICRDDAVIVLKSAVELLLFLESEDRNFCYISPQPVKYKASIIQFSDLIRSL